MPVVDVEGCPIHVEVQGSEDAPVLMLSNSLGTTHRMWDDQVKPFTEAFRLVRYDRRGHGQSGCPKGPYTMERLGRDVLAILDALGIEKVNWCGLSMGGMVGMWLGAHAPERIERLVLCCTSAHLGPREMWDQRIAAVRRSGSLEPLADAAMERWLTPAFRAEHPEAEALLREGMAATDPGTYVANCAAIRDMDLRGDLGAIRAPALVIAGTEDPATPPDHAE
ncbi:MAG: 3-oxoadipate enol-lactonase, partial [Xanthobacteraceae bacterium]